MGTADFQKDLRWMLIQMLFSLVIAAIAQQSARLIAQKRRWIDAYPIVAHLALVTSVVTTSWIGWTKAISFEMRSEHHLQSIFDDTFVFSVPFVLLLIDIALVTCYFIMADGAEIPAQSTQKVTPSARNETLWLMIIFFGYLMWGAVAHGIGHDLREFVDSLWSYLLCLALAIATWWFLGESATPAGVAATDVALIGLVFLFRAIRPKDWHPCAAVAMGGVFATGFVYALALMQTKRTSPRSRRRQGA
jgi:hypothetical protein